MSDATAVFLMLGIYTMVFLVAMYVTKVANDRMDDILTGAVRGIAVSRTHRSVMLWNEWLSYMSGLAGGSVVMAFGHLQIAALVSSDGVRLLAYFLAAFFGWVFALYLFLGASTLLQCLSVLRQAEAD